MFVPTIHYSDEDQDASAELGETRVTGLFHEREIAKKAVDELKTAGFNGDAIAIAMEDEAEQESFIQQAQAQAVPAELIPSLPELPPRAVLVLVEADDRAAEALDVLIRHHAVTGGVRMPID